MLNKKFLKKIKERLILEKDELLKKSTQRPDIDTDGDEVDEIQGNVLIELHNQFTNRNNSKLIQIEDSLKKIEDCTYGLCQDCGENIPEKRLSANPYFLSCVACVEAQEIQDKQRKRY